MAEAVPEHINFPQTEEEVMKFWAEIDAFKTSMKQSLAEKRPRYIFNICRVMYRTFLLPDTGCSPLPILDLIFPYLKNNISLNFVFFFTFFSSYIF